MLFSSVEYIIFFPVIFILYWKLFSKNSGQQNLCLLLASFIFYGWTDWRFLFLIFSSIVINYFAGIQLSRSQSEKNKQFWLWLAVLVNLGILAYFKYFNFFYEEFCRLFSMTGVLTSYAPLNILLPLGVSFFTFQNTGYLIDVYNEKSEPCRNFITFATFVAFFPKLLAGPIERAQHLIPQLERKRIFDPAQAADGCRQIVWGAFAKLVIADNCEGFVTSLFNGFHSESGSTLLLAAILYFIQVYSDFSGYSNMAIGFAKCLGVQLARNFATPLFAISISDFWRRWHISLTSWMMDYLFTPLSFLLRRHAKTGLFVSISITFITVGLWHGANWTFLAFGILQSIYFLPMAVTGTINKPAAGNLTNVERLMRTLVTFLLMALAFILLRAETLPQAFNMYQKIFSIWFFQLPPFDLLKNMAYLFLLIIFFILHEWKTRNRNHPMEKLFPSRHFGWRWIYYSFIILLLCLYMATSESPFIYFQF